MSTIVTRAGKGSALTHNEVDANFNNLNNDKIEAAQTVTLTNKTLSTGTAITAGTINGATIGATTPSSGAFTTLSATGVTTVQAGTAAAPAITTSGDTNTGIYFPAADTIAFTEGGVESMRLNSSGNVGIGTTSPASKLQAYAGTGVGASHAIFGASATGFWNFNSGGVSSDRVIARGYNSIGTEVIRLDPAGDSFINGGNLGLGVTPSASWATSNFKALQIKNGSAAAQGGADLWLFANAVYDGTNFKYLNASSSRASVYRLDDGQHLWYNTVAGTAGNNVTLNQVMTLDTSGRLGIGTSSPNRNVVVDGGSSDAYLKLTTSATASNFSSGILFNNTLNSDGNIYIRVNGGESNLVFGTGGSERARIDTASLTLSAIRILISGASGIPAPVNNGDGNMGTSAVNGLNLIGKGSTNDIIFLNKDGNTAGRVATGATTITTSSDERLKENLVPIQNAVDKVAQLRTVTGNYKSDPSRNVAFLIAQDVDAVFPQAVEKGDPEELGINYNWVIPLALAAIKEQQAMIDELKAKVAALENA